MSSIELAIYVDQELESNPLLEVDEAAEQPVMTEALGGTAEQETTNRDDEAPAEPRDIPFEYESEGDDDDPTVSGRQEYSDEGQELGAGSWATVRVPSGFEGTDIERAAADGGDLRAHLNQQLNLAAGNNADLMIGGFLIEQLDENGYLGAAVADVVAQLGSTAADVERVLAMLQKFDPPGIFARDLKECLKLQLIDRDRFDPAMESFVSHIELLGTGELKRLREICRVSEEDLQDMVAEIRALDPKPALRFERRQDETIVPDIIMTARADGGWRIELNPETLPRVLVNQSYVSEITRVVSTTAEKGFLQERLQAANWLVRALQQRAETILKVSTEIVKQQDAFFRKGLSHLKPLVLKDISGPIEMHESTVSRVTTNKFIMTPRGTFELKYFFSHNLGSSDSGGVAAASVHQRIKDLIAAETAETVLSDDDIVVRLRGEGIELARRTVAKYRESLHIQSSVQRRRRLMLALRGAG